MTSPENTLQLVHLGINTQREYVVFMRQDCPIGKSEGFEAHNRLLVEVKGKTIIATLNIIMDGILAPGKAGLSESAWQALNAQVGDPISFSHMPPVESMQFVRSKMYGNRLSNEALDSIIRDIAQDHYSPIETAAFLTACAGDNLNIEEITGLTQAMIKVGHKLIWESPIVVDKHCVGGLPGNRTTPIVVSIVADCGLTIPKTSSRAITSPAGTADTLETITAVDLNMSQIRKVVEQENGCFVWGGSVKLSPADDILIRVERALDIDSEGQMIASVLSKKAAAGSTHVVIDIPVGPTAKVRTEADAEKLKYYFKVVGRAIGLQIKVLLTDGSQPVGRGIGPGLEAMDVLSVLRNEEDAPRDLRERSLLLAATLLDLAAGTPDGKGRERARDSLDSGRAYKKFKAICLAQGRFTKPKIASFKQEIYAEQSGRIVKIDNRKLAKVAKLAGAPLDPTAGLWLKSGLQTQVEKGELLFCIYAASVGQLKYALDYLNAQPPILVIQ